MGNWFKSGRTVSRGTSSHEIDYGELFTTYMRKKIKIWNGNADKRGPFLKRCNEILNVVQRRIRRVAAALAATFLI